ncbi:MAG: glycine--tRNA ligase [Candidatus Moranbacteria bacterium]|nr:glycine--tRNA ligase [Candidatus Moranbacteria bacterium]
MPSDKMQKIVSLCKRRGFVYPGSEIYGGLANSWDYGPLGAELKNNLKKIWWKHFVQDREDMVGIDGGVLLNPKVWEASGHIKNFKDPLVECKDCHRRFRPDKLKDVSKCPECGGKFTKAKMFSGMFKTVIGPIEEEGLTTFLRPETAQNMFVNFRNILDSTNKKIPFGVGQIGRSFRNEITAGNFIFRTLEFEIMEIEYFIAPDANWKKMFESWIKAIYQYAGKLGLSKKGFYNHEIPAKDRAFYSKRTIDFEYKYPWGLDELWAIAYRTNYDLACHQKFSGQNLEYFDDVRHAKYIPHVIEPTFGVDRTVLALLVESYTEEKIRGGDTRIVLKFKPAVAPYKIAVFPLLANKKNLVKKAREVYDILKNEYLCFWDDRGNIGKRYRYQDEIGTPYCVTVDFDSLKDKAVTVRDRDSMKQKRVKISGLREFFNQKLK